MIKEDITLHSFNLDPYNEVTPGCIIHNGQFSKYPQWCKSIADSSNQDTLTGPKGGRIIGSPLYRLHSLLPDSTPTILHAHLSLGSDLDGEVALLCPGAHVGEALCHAHLAVEPAGLLEVDEREEKLLPHIHSRAQGTPNVAELGVNAWESYKMVLWILNRAITCSFQLR